MIVAKVAQAVLKLLLPKVTEHLMKAFKLEKLVNYMDNPNDCDKRVDKLEEWVKLLQKDSHEPKEFSKRAKALEEKFESIENDNKELKSFMKQIKNKKMFKKMEAKLNK